MIEYLVNYLAKDGTIVEEEKEIVRFGLHSLNGNLVCIILTLIVGIVFQRIADAALLWAFLFPLRKNVGGYHAVTKIGCFFMSMFLLVMAFIGSSVFSFDLMAKHYFVCGLISGIIIWFTAPVDSPAKRLDMTEFRVYRNRSRISVLFDSLILIVASRLQFDIVVRSIVMAYLIVDASLIMGKLKVREKI